MAGFIEEDERVEIFKEGLFEKKLDVMNKFIDFIYCTSICGCDYQRAWGVVIWQNYMVKEYWLPDELKNRLCGLVGLVSFEKDPHKRRSLGEKIKFLASLTPDPTYLDVRNIYTCFSCKYDIEPGTERYLMLNQICQRCYLLISEKNQTVIPTGPMGMTQINLQLAYQ